MAFIMYFSLHVLFLILKFVYNGITYGYAPSLEKSLIHTQNWIFIQPKARNFYFYQNQFYLHQNQFYLPKF